MRKINVKINSEINKAEWMSFNPYEIIGLEPKPFTPRDLFIGEILIDKNGDFIEITDFGSAGFFGKDSYSWIWIQIKKTKSKKENPNRFYFSINTHNPKEVYHKNPERPDGSKYGGVGFGGWFNSIEEAINSFPNKHRKKSTGSLYWNKTLKITKINKTDLETGEIEIIEPTKKHNQILNNLKYDKTNHI